MDLRAGSIPPAVLHGLGVGEDLHAGRMSGQAGHGPPASPPPGGGGRMGGEKGAPFATLEGTWQLFPGASSNLRAGAAVRTGERLR